MNEELGTRSPQDLNGYEMPMPQSGAPPLQGVKVVDFSRIIAGPLCTQILTDMGAKVVKIENPATGDDTRRMLKPTA